MNVDRLRADMVSYRQRHSSVLDKYLFFIVFLVGAVGIVSLKRMGLSQIVVTAMPVLLMGVYFVYIIATKRFQLREDIAGDNLYYLGFLYTLTSLSYALYLFAKEQGGAEAIISNFGIALATTIIGLALRVALYQMRQDPVEIEKEARIELGEAALRLKHELDNVVVEMNSFRRATQQSISEGLKEIADLAQGEVIKAFNNVSNEAHGVVFKIDEAFASFTQNANQMDNVTSKTVNSVENLIERLESIKVPENIIEEKLETAVQGIGEVVKELTVLAKEDQKVVRRLSRMIGKAVDSTELLDGRIDALNKQMEPLQGVVIRITEMGEGLNDIKAQTVTVLDTIKKTARNHESILHGISEASESILRVVKQQEDAIGEVLTKGKENSEVILQQTRANADNQTKVLDVLVSALEMNLETVRRHNQAFEAEYERARVITAKVQASLASMSALLIKKLGSPVEEKSSEVRRGVL